MRKSSASTLTTDLAELVEAFVRIGDYKQKAGPSTSGGKMGSLPRWKH
jgi:hypothetical protein